MMGESCAGERRGPRGFPVAGPRVPDLPKQEYTLISTKESYYELGYIP